MKSESASYKAAGVDITAGYRAVELMKKHVARTMIPGVLEGNEGQKHLEEYADSSCERGKCLLRAICEQFGFDSLSYQSLEGMLEAIGIDREQVCTYCWTGKE